MVTAHTDLADNLRSIHELLLSKLLSLTKMYLHPYVQENEK